MNISIAISEVASECESRAISFDYTEKSQAEWGRIADKLRQMEARIERREEKDGFEFSPAVEFPTPTSNEWVQPR